MSGREYIIRLPWPSEPLWQNRRVHWSKRSKATKIARHYAAMAAREAGVPYLPDAMLEFSFYPPPMSRPDLQNMPATMKAYIDGIADAMKVDDRKFNCVWPSKFGERTKGGAVLVHVKPV